MTFEMALLEMRQGSNLRRATWGPECWLYVLHGYMYRVRNGSGSMLATSLRTADILGEDWEIAK